MLILFIASIIWYSDIVTPNSNFVLIVLVGVILIDNYRFTWRLLGNTAYSYTVEVTVHPDWLEILKRILPTLHEDVLKQLLANLQQLDDKNYDVWKRKKFSWLVTYNSVGGQKLVWDGNNSILNNSMLSNRINPIFCRFPDDFLINNNIHISPEPFCIWLHPGGILLENNPPAGNPFHWSGEWGEENKVTFSKIPFYRIMASIIETAKSGKESSLISNEELSNLSRGLYRENGVYSRRDYPGFCSPEIPDPIMKEMLDDLKVVFSCSFGNYLRQQQRRYSYSPMQDIRDESESSFIYNFTAECHTLSVELHNFGLYSLFHH